MRFAKSLGGLGLFTTAYATYKYKSDEGFRRSVTLFSVCGPIVVHYRGMQIKHKIFPPKTKQEEDDDWRALDRAYSDKVLRMLQNLKGLYVKYGQLGAGLVPPIWAKKLATLEDQVPCESFETVKQTIREELGDVDRIFRSFERDPIGAASIGQVHRAVLRDGTTVACKVQYPTSQRLFKNDMAAIRNFCKMFAPEQLLILDELERTVSDEFDYLKEAQNLIDVQKAMVDGGFSHEVVVPAPKLQYCTKRVLVMDFLEGPKLHDGVMKYAAHAAEAQGKSIDEYQREIKDRIKREGFPARYEGPSSREIEAYRRYLKAKDFALNAVFFLLNHTLGKLFGFTLDYQNSVVPPNIPHIMDVLMRVHGHQLLVNGVFQADPHAGNFLLLPDNRIGLIDYGSTKRLRNSDRLISCVLYVALAEEDKKMLMDLAINGGYKSPNMDLDVMWNMTKFGFDTFGRELLGDKNVQEFIDEQYSKDPWEEVADNLVMAEFLSMRIRTVGMKLLFPVVCSTYWGDIARKALRDAGHPYESWNLAKMALMTRGTLNVTSGTS